MFELRTARLDDPVALPLLDSLRAEYAALYGDVVDGEIDSYESSRFDPPGGMFLLLIRQSISVAGGGYVQLHTRTAEIKRMWTSPDHRRRGYARVVLAELERRAASAGYDDVWLQTGDAQHAAIDLYEATGYRAIAPFGAYRNEPRARAYAKSVAHLRTHRADVPYWARMRLAAIDSTVAEC